MRKIKRFTVILLTTVLFLTACGGGGKPDDVSEEMYQKALYAIKVCDLYLDGSTTQEETIEKLKGIDTPDIEVGSSSSNEVAIWSGIMGLHADCTKMKFEEFELSSFKEHRNKIAEAINYKD